MLKRIVLFFLPFFLSSCYVCYYRFNSDKMLIDKTIKIEENEFLRFLVDVNEHSHTDKLKVFLMPLNNFEVIDVSVKFETSNIELTEVDRYLDNDYLFTCPDFKKTLEASNYLQLKVFIKNKTTSITQTKEYTLYKQKKCNFLFVLH